MPGFPSLTLLINMYLFDTATHQRIPVKKRVSVIIL